jgi:hypothetical protein
MHNKILYTIVLFLIVFSAPFNRHYAQDIDKDYQVNMHLGLGYSFYLTSLNYENLHANPFIYTGRLMWKPEHLLSIGIESGYVPLYWIETKDAQSVFGATDITIWLDMIPIILVLTMDIDTNFKIIGGLGEFLLLSEVESFNNEVLSKSWSTGYEMGAAYMKPVSRNWQIGGEMKLYYISKLQDFDLLLQLSLSYNLLSY